MQDYNQQTPCHYSRRSSGTTFALENLQFGRYRFPLRIARAAYYAVESNANVINMSLDTQTNSQELQTALGQANPTTSFPWRRPGTTANQLPKLFTLPSGKSMWWKWPRRATQIIAAREIIFDRHHLY